MYQLIRPLLFALKPETAHFVALEALQLAYCSGLLSRIVVRPTDSPRKVMGLVFPNPIGLAAGLDKDGDYIDALAALGFGFIEIGTVTPSPQGGSPRPRLFRLTKVRGVINRMGFNNHGVDALIENVKRAKYSGILGINIGKGRDTPIDHAAADYLIGLRRVYAHASYIAINISSPNTKNLRQLQRGDELDALLSQLKAEQARMTDLHGRYVPLALKISPDLDSDQVHQVAALLQRHHIDGVIATNTTVARNGLEHLVGSAEVGGLSGAPLGKKSTAVVGELAAALQGAIPIIGVGGIMGGCDAVEKMHAGAALVQLYSGLLYCGTGLIDECAKATQD